MILKVKQNGDRKTIRKITKSNKTYKAELPKNNALDIPLVLLTLMLMLFGLLMLFSASYAEAYYDTRITSPLYYVIRQGIYMVAGLVVMFIVSRIDYHHYTWIGIGVFAAAFFFLCLVPVLGTELNGAKRWVFGFQPSEIMKTGIIMTFSAFATRYHSRIRTIKYGLLPYAIVLGVVAFLLSLQPHLSATLIIVGTGFVILFVAGIKIWYFFPIGIAGFTAVYFYIQSNEYAMKRIEVWFDPFSDFLGNGWQGAQSFIAIGSGGLWGLGLGEGRQKHLYLPEPMNDFIFSVTAEELGFIGACAVIILFSALIIRGFNIAFSAKDKFGCLLASGIVGKLAIQVLVNLFVVTGIFPVTGAALPFFSYGGTALMVQLFEIGILLNISRNIKAKKVG